MSTTLSSLSQEEMIAKIYRDFARLSGEVAIDRCRTRVLLKLVKERLDLSDDDLNELFREELEANLEQFCHDITRPMLVEFEEPAAGCCGGTGSLLQDTPSAE